MLLPSNPLGGAASAAACSAGSLARRPLSTGCRKPLARCAGHTLSESKPSSPNPIAATCIPSLATEGKDLGTPREAQVAGHQEVHRPSGSLPRCQAPSFPCAWILICCRVLPAKLEPQTGGQHLKRTQTYPMGYGMKVGGPASRAAGLWCNSKRGMLSNHAACLPTH